MTRWRWCASRSFFLRNPLWERRKSRSLRPRNKRNLFRMANGLKREVDVKRRPIQVIRGWPLDLRNLSDAGIAEPGKLGEGNKQILVAQRQPKACRLTGRQPKLSKCLNKARGISLAFSFMENFTARRRIRCDHLWIRAPSAAPSTPPLLPPPLCRTNVRRRQNRSWSFHRSDRRAGDRSSPPCH